MKNKKHETFKEADKKLKNAVKEMDTERDPAEGGRTTIEKAIEIQSHDLPTDEREQASPSSNEPGKPEAA